MRKIISKSIVCLMALTLAVPESFARRLGAGRSVGRQAPMGRQYSPAPMQRQQPLPPAAPRPQPDLARQSFPAPAVPLPRQSPITRQASTPWGGMLGGALLGLGLGSLMSSGDRNRANPNPADPNGVNQSGSTSGASNTGTTAGGAGDNTAAPQNPATPVQQAPQSRFLPLLLWGLLAAGVYMLIRRSRARALQRRM